MNPQLTVIMKKESAMGKIVPFPPYSHKEIRALSMSELKTVSEMIGGGSGVGTYAGERDGLDSYCRDEYPPEAT